MEAPRPGAPARDTGLPPGVVVGGLARRLAAWLIDSVIPAAAGLVAGVVPGLGGGASVAVVVVAAAVALAWGLLCWWRLSLRAATPGMTVTKLQLVGFLDGRPVGWSRVLVRWLVFAVLGVTVVGLIMLLVFLLLHPRRQGWHDLAANAVVIGERPLAPPRKRPADRRPAQVDPGPEPAPAPSASGSDRSPAGATARSEPLAATAPSAGDAKVDTGAASDTAGGDTLGGETTESSRTTRPTVLQGWRVELDDGREIDVEGLVLLGRNPQPRPGEEDAHLVKLADQTRTVSKTHLALGVDDAGLFVVDRGSTNGSTVTAPDGAATTCTPHTAVSVEGGSVVSLGDHWLRIRRDSRVS